jgi:hypothetical protein
MNTLYSGTDQAKAYEVAAQNNLKVMAMKMGRGAKSWTVYHVWSEN